MDWDLLGFDTYQMTTLTTHDSFDDERISDLVSMSFFYRKLPSNRNFVVFAGMPLIREWCANVGCDDETMETLRADPLFGPYISGNIIRQLQRLDKNGFTGAIDVLREGTLTFAGPARTTDGALFRIRSDGPPLPTSTPLLQAHVNAFLAKFIETPWLSRINEMSMVASKAARVALAADGVPVLEFGQRRKHPVAARDAAYAAYIGGCSGTSNYGAHVKYGVPTGGTMDHFAVQFSKKPGLTRREAQRQFFRASLTRYPKTPLLICTYDPFDGAEDACTAAKDVGVPLPGVRLDYAVTAENLVRLRKLLDEHGQSSAGIVASGGLEEYKVRELRKLGIVTAFGVGEHIVCSPDAPIGIGAVAKLNSHDEEDSMKFTNPSLPGCVQVWRMSDHDFIGEFDEAGPNGGVPLLQPIPTQAPTPQDTRAYVREQIAKLPEKLRRLEVAGEEDAWSIVISDRLAEKTRRILAE